MSDILKIKEKIVILGNTYRPLIAGEIQYSAKSNIQVDNNLKIKDSSKSKSENDIVPDDTKNEYLIRSKGLDAIRYTLPYKYEKRDIDDTEEDYLVEFENFHRDIVKTQAQAKAITITLPSLGEFEAVVSDYSINNSPNEKRATYEFTIEVIQVGFDEDKIFEAGPTAESINVQNAANSALVKEDVKKITKGFSLAQARAFLKVAEAELNKVNNLINLPLGYVNEIYSLVSRTAVDITQEVVTVEEALQNYISAATNIGALKSIADLFINLESSFNPYYQKPSQQQESDNIKSGVYDDLRFINTNSKFRLDEIKATVTAIDLMNSLYFDLIINSNLNYRPTQAEFKQVSFIFDFAYDHCFNQQLPKPLDFTRITDNTELRFAYLRSKNEALSLIQQENTIEFDNREARLNILDILRKKYPDDMQNAEFVDYIYNDLNKGQFNKDKFILKN